MPASKFSAVLLAAGRSTRMGRDKAMLECERDGADSAAPDRERVPLWQRQRDVLAHAGAAEIFLSAREEQVWAARAVGDGKFAAVVRDAVPGCGPLAGIAAALACASHPHVAVLAIDLPRMNAEWFATLRAECAPGVGCVGRRQASGGGKDGEGIFFEPLAAIYPRELLPLAAAALARGEFSLQRLLAAAVAQGLMRVHEIGADEGARFENWNAPAK